MAKVTLGADFREALKTKTTPSPSHQVDFTGLVSPRVSTQDKLDDDGLIVVQPRLQNVLIRLKQTSTTIDDGTSGIHNKPPASPSLSSPSQRKSLQNLFVKTKSSRIGSVASGKGSHGSHEEQSKHCSSRVPNSGCKTKESKSVASGKASTSSSQAGTESDHSQSQNIIDKTKDETGLQKVLPTHSMERFEAEEEPINDAILMAPKLTDVVLHGRNAPKIPPKSTRKGSPSLPRKTISESSEPSEFGNYDRLKRANDLIQEQRRKKEESRSRQKELEEQNIALEQSPTILKKEIAYVVSMPDKPTGSPRRAGWGLLKSMKGSSTTQLSNDRSEQQQSDTVALDLPSKVTELQGTKQFEEIKPKSNRRRSHPEDSADTCKPSSSKWKDLSARLESQDNAKATMGSDSPGSKSKYARKNEGRKTSDQSPGTLSPGRLSKWTGLRGARKFMSNVGRQGEHHRLLLDDDDE